MVTESSAKTTPPRIGPVRSTGGAQVRSVDIGMQRNYYGDIRPPVSRSGLRDGDGGEGPVYGGLEIREMEPNVGLRCRHAEQG